MQFDLVVLGSINLDVKALITTYPKHGDTATAKSITMLPGGKGSNQAVAAAKLGGKVAMLGAVGEDGAGKQMLDNLKEWDVDTRFVMRNPDEGTGTFIVQVDQTSENTMVGTLGANDTIKGTEVAQALDEVEAPVLLLQLETSRESVLAALQAGKQKGMYIILDPAPADGFFKESLAYADCVTPNQQETERITGIHVTNKVEAVEAAKAIAAMGPDTVIVKLGAEGSVVLHESEIYEIDSVKVHALDSVCAGDVFAGALAVSYAQHGDFLKAVNFANKAAAIKVSRIGNHQAFPTLVDMNR